MRNFTGVVVVSVVFLLAATARVDAAVVDYYSRFCTAMVPTNATMASFREGTLRSAASQDASLAADAPIAQAVRAQLKLSTAPELIGIEIPFPLDGPSSVMLSNRDASAPQWWEAKLKADHTLLSVAAADPLAVKQFVNFPRFMAAFIVFNDLMGGDEPFPREGCHAIFDAWFRPFPGIRARLDAAITTMPEQVLEETKAIQRAWRSFATQPVGVEADALDVTNETVKRIGMNPAVTIVYCYVGLPGDGVGEMDVVRIGSTPHTYQIVSFGADHLPLLGASAVCTVGDTRCARFYRWP